MLTTPYEGTFLITIGRAVLSTLTAHRNRPVGHYCHTTKQSVHGGQNSCRTTDVSKEPPVSAFSGYNLKMEAVCSSKALLDSTWNVMAHDDTREGKWRGNWWMDWVVSTLHTTREHGVSSITTADAHTSTSSSRLNWRSPADLNELVRFAGRRNLVSARVPLHFNWPLPKCQTTSSQLRRQHNSVMLWTPMSCQLWRVSYCTTVDRSASTRSGVMECSNNRRP